MRNPKRSKCSTTTKKKQRNLKIIIKMAWLKYELVILIISATLVQQSSEGVACWLDQEKCDCSITNKIFMTCGDQDIVNSTHFPSTKGLFKNITYYLRINGRSYHSIDAFSFEPGLQIQYLELTKNQLYRIGSDTFGHIIGLNILSVAENRLSDLQFLSNACNLTQVYINDNMLTSLNKSWFECLTKLKYLDLKQNEIVDISGGLFSTLAEATSIDLSYNKITFIGKHVFKGLAKLEQLNLFHNKLKKVDSYGFYGLEKFEGAGTLTYGLYLSSQLIEELESYAFTGLSKLTAIFLDSNRLATIRNFTFHGLVSCTLIKMAKNKIESIQPLAFYGLANLNELELYHNELKEIKNTYFQGLKKLTSLSILDNQIGRIEAGSFADMANSLNQLDLSSNKLNSISYQWLQGLSMLTSLNLSYNQISNVESGSFASLKSLQNLYLDQNCISKLGSNPFNGLTALKLLNLDRNLFNTFKPDTFSNLKKLETLIVSNNLLVVVQPYYFNNLISLKKLSLSSNVIKYLGSSLFVNLTKLTTLDLSNNLIKHVVSTSFTGLGSLKELWLDLNPLESLSQSIKWMTRLRNIYLSETKIVSVANEINYVTDLNLYFSKTTESMWPSLLKDLIDLKIPSNRIMTLDLSHNDMSAYPIVNVLNQIREVRVLYLRNTNQVFVMDSLSILLDLDTVDLSGNKLYFKKYKFMYQSTKLQNIILSNVSLDSLDSHFDFNLFQMLATLDLSLNRIETIKAEHFRKSTTLNKLNMSGNMIKVIETLNTPYLGDLDLSFNQIVNFSKSITQQITINKPFSLLISNNLIVECEINSFLTPLTRKLRLENNRLAEIPIFFSKTNSALGNFDSLTDLNLRLNQIESVLRGSLYALFTLEMLDLSFNLIERIDPYSFENLPILVELDLGSNQLSYLDPYTFYGLGSLRYLNLSSNRIESIDKRLFSFTVNLIYLDLDYNSLKIIEDGTFLALNYLKYLYLNSISVEEISSTLFDGLSSFESIWVSDEMFESSINVINLVTSLIKYSKVLKASKTGVDYYNSLNINFRMDTSYFSTKQRCFMTLYMMFFKIQLNLETDQGAKIFMTECYDLQLSNVYTYLKQNNCSLYQVENYEIYLSLV